MNRTASDRIEEKAALDIISQEQLYQYLLENFDWARDYIYYYVYIAYVTRESIVPILKSILEEDRRSYTLEKAYQYLKDYEGTKGRIAVIVPTCNRIEAVSYILDYVSSPYRRFGVDIIIYDSSDNDKIEKLTRKMHDNGYSNVVYKRYKGVFDGFSLDHKIISAYEEFADSYDYIWICRDGLVPVIDEIIEKLRHYWAERVPCIIVDTKSRNNGVEIEREYSTLDDCNAFLTDQATRLQTLGMLILSGNFAKKLIREIPLDDTTYSLWQMAAPFHLFAKEPYRIVFLTRNVFAMNPLASATHFWSKAHKALEQWARRWHQIIVNMPSEYDKSKKECMMVYTVDFHPFAYRTIIDMRAWGGLNRELVIQYKDDLAQTTRTSIKFFLVVATMPKWFARGLSRYLGKHPDFSHKIRTRIFGDAAKKTTD